MAIAGYLLGLMHGDQTIPRQCLDALVLRKERRELACGLLADLGGAELEAEYPAD